MRIKLKAGIIGFGYMGEIRKKVVEENPSLELSGVCDINKVLLDERAWNCKTYDSYKELLEDDVDVVFVCTPNSYSPMIVRDSMRRGKHVFCEKPPGRSSNDIRTMIEVERENPACKLMFGFNHRYHPGILRAKTIVDSGRYGQVLMLKGTYGKSGGNDYLQSWRNNKKISGGGILLDQGIHMLDLFRYFCGDFNEVKGFLSDLFWRVGVEDNAFVCLRNEKGQVASLHSSAILWKHCFKLEVFLADAYMIVSGLLSKTGSYGRETLTIGKRQFEDESCALGNPAEEIIYFDRDMSWALEVEYFIECIQGEKKIENSSSLDALQVMELVEMAYEDDNMLLSNKLKEDSFR
ncbi:MAG: Gfo/Idh/MocA family protein [Candidatus Scalindua sp.]